MFFFKKIIILYFILLINGCSSYNLKEIADKNDLIRGIQIVTSYLDKNILQPNNLNHPLQRVDFINTLK